MTEQSLQQSPSELLKQRTGDLHELVEEVLGEQFFSGDDFDRGDFENLLVAFYRIYRPLEQVLPGALERHLPDYPYESRTDRLESDLEVLGVNEDDRARIEVLDEADVVDLDGVEQLYGCLYVVEGSEMGNRVIRKQLEKNLPEDCLDADQFFRPQSPVERWNDFKTRVDDEISSTARMETVVQSARRTFRMFRKGFQ
jgi:heme oxygenase